MKKMMCITKGILRLGFLIILVGCLAGCGNKQVAADTIGTQYEQAFMKSSGTNPNDIADELMKEKRVEYDLVKMDVVPGYLSGFDKEIHGFTSGVQFAPMIGSIPFVAYVFESDNPKALADTLEAEANLAWNICTEADEKVVAVNNNFVFFVMCANRDE